MVSEPINPKYLIEIKGFHYTAEQYSKRGLIGTSPDYVPLEKIIFKPTHTNYGVVLQGPKKGRKIDIAVLGFNATEDVSDCLEIHGGRGMYGPLSCVRWETELLSTFVSVSRLAGMQAAQLIPAIEVEGLDGNNYERLMRLYNINASNQGFRFSKEARRFILDL